MTKIKINDNSGADDTTSVVSPTQSQMDQWVEAELAEATTDDMLGNTDATTIFKNDESTNESID